MFQEVKESSENFSYEKMNFNNAGMDVGNNFNMNMGTQTSCNMTCPSMCEMPRERICHRYFCYDV